MEYLLVGSALPSRLVALHAFQPETQGAVGRAPPGREATASDWTSFNGRFRPREPTGSPERHRPPANARVPGKQEPPQVGPVAAEHKHRHGGPDPDERDHAN